MKRHEQKLVFLIPILVGLIIMISSVVAFYQLSEYEKRISDSFKYSIRDMIYGVLERRESRVETIGTSYVGFYEGSENITREEFVNFSNRILEVNPEIVNVFVLNKTKVLQSFPNSEFIGKDFDNEFPNFPAIINEQKVMNVEFFFNELSVVVSVPFDYFVSVDTISGNFKLILFSPLDDNTRLYQISKLDNNVIYDDIVFTNSELNSSIILSQDTSLYGHHLKQNYTLEYLIWNDTFEANNLTNNMLLLFGIVLGIIISILMYKTNILRQRESIQLKIIDEKNQQLKQVEQSKEEFVTMIVHDLKNPLLPIRAFSDILLSKQLGELNSKQMERINLIKTSALTLQKLIQDLLDVNKLELGKLSIQLSKNNLSDIVEDVISNLKPEFERNQVSIETRISKNIFCMCDRIRIEQVISNILLNSLDFVPEKTGLVIVMLDHIDNVVRITVQDNGIGMNQEQLDNIFGKFYQTKQITTRKYGGSGLGLAVCHGIIALHNGKIWAESEGFGKGTKFFIDLPAIDDDSK